MDANVGSVIDANAAFYAALERRDVVALDELIVSEPFAHSTVLVHPSRFPIVGRPEVLESWRAFVESEQYVQFFLADVDARVSGDVASVSCTEDLLLALDDGQPGRDGRLAHRKCVATNVFVREESGTWKLWVHHATRIHQPADRLITERSWH